MFEITICVGSSCHLKGSYEVIKEFERAISLYGLEGHIVLKAGFCLGRCGEGVTVKVGENYYSSVFPKDVANLVERIKNNISKDDVICK
ncbi:Thioredoxin-like [2Fe-2S] ferredoxin [Caldanaerovirga acetigignens]|uniref:Thioredoxin-like [2Fe-2S] ferredoxin n=1 Tax=Caldanaerovirga acetigignens TaxID=447595 RepID=A0A1M7MQG7_9FIRM|nr:(2Fe-2S) ferredoxin domain-containing protein [Caldanaerovirga acetigignens]SHM93225.1 Thioredoxin-like [2Fe-2S] ferredoxin [Caldanaerovirga acetigignens]